MLHWVGKKPLARVTAFPAQAIEAFDPLGESTGPAQANGGRFYHGDCKEVLAHLLASGHRGKINLVYIDPPFDSGADYVRKVSLRGKSAIANSTPKPTPSANKSNTPTSGPTTPTSSSCMNG